MAAVQNLRRFHEIRLMLEAHMGTKPADMLVQQQLELMSGGDARAQTPKGERFARNDAAQSPKVITEELNNTGSVIGVRLRSQNAPSCRPIAPLLGTELPCVMLGLPLIVPIPRRLSRPNMCPAMPPSVKLKILTLQWLAMIGCRMLGWSAIWINLRLRNPLRRKSVARAEVSRTAKVGALLASKSWLVSQA